MRRWLAPAPLLLVALAPVQAQSNDPLFTGDCVSELGLARIAEEAGDAQLAAQLARTDARQTTLVAVRASPHAQAPEALVPRLAALACGRDAALAPEAGYALARIGERLVGSELAAREALHEELVAAQKALACAEQVPAPRADIVHQLAQLGAALDVLLR